MPQTPRIPTPAEIRAAYPGAYDDLSDAELQEALSKKASADQGFLASFWEQVSAVPGNLYTVMTTSPWETVKGVASNTYNAGVNAFNAMAAGDTETANRNIVRGLPWFGDAALKASDQMREGNYAGAGGTLTGLAAVNLAPEAARLLPRTVRAGGWLRNQNPKYASAIDYGLANDVRMNLGAASGRPNMQRLDLISDASSIPGLLRDAEGNLAADLTRVSSDLSQQIKPGGRVSAEQAGETTHSAVKARADFYKRQADRAFADVRAKAAQNAVPIQVPVLKDGRPVFVKAKNAAGQTVRQQQFRTVNDVPVDVTNAKAALQSEYDTWNLSSEGKRQWSDEFTALKSIMEGPSIVPLSVAMKNLSALGPKALPTGAAGFTEAGNRMAAQSYGAYRKAVEDAIDGIGARAEYDAGMRASRSQWRVADRTERIFPRTKGKDVDTNQTLIDAAGGFKRLIGADINQLRQVQKIAPQVLPDVGRAVFDDIIARATEGGKWDHHIALKNAWETMDPRKKDLLYGNGALRKNLDEFFVMQDAVASRVNPSGTGPINVMFKTMKQAIPSATVGAAGYTAGGGAGAAAAYATQQALSSLYNLTSYAPKAVRALVQGANVPVRRPAVFATQVGQMSQFAPDIMRPTQVQGPVMEAVQQESEKYITLAELEALAQMLGTDVNTQAERARAEGYVIR